MCWLVTVLSCGPAPCASWCSGNCDANHSGHTCVAHLLSSGGCCAAPIMARKFHVILRWVLLMDLLPVVVVVAQVDASVTDPGDTSCCRSVPGCTRHLSGHWCRRFLCRSCRSPLCIVWPCVLVVRICSKHLLHVFLLLLFFLVGCCSILCLFRYCCILFLCHILVVL